MGISIREILDNNFFKDYELMAGHGGLNNQVQGIAILDAPDGFNWTTNKELVLTSGYVFQQNPGLLEKYVQTDYFKNTSAVGIKVDRFLHQIPKHILNFFDEYKIPLINVPSKDSWMIIVNNLNILILNKNIKQFKIEAIDPKSFSDLSYQERKINKILSQIEYEMNFPAMLYDLNSDNAYFSSPKFKNLAGDLKLEDFWNPSFNFTQEVLCDNLQMCRYRFIKKDHEIPYSWITVPITAGNKVQAYFVLVEAMGLIDYFDQFAIRIGFLLIQSLYENMMVAQFIGDIGFEKFIMDLIHGNTRSIYKNAIELGIDTNNKYFLVLMQQSNPDINISNHKEDVKNCANNSIIKIGARMAIIEDNSCLFLLPFKENTNKEDYIKLIQKEAENFSNRLERRINIVLSDIEESIYEFSRNYERCKKTMSMGKLLYPNNSFIMYSELGAFAWLDIQDDELDIMLKDIGKLNCEKYKEHIDILKIYLECNMNYSITAKKLFLHINTVRKKIDEINNLIDIDLENPTNRLKLEIMLKLFN